MPIILSKYSSKCRQCTRWTSPGDQVYWEQGIKGVLCLRCTPADKLPPFTPKTELALSNGQAPWLAVLVACERAIVDNAATTLTPELEAAFEKYQKLKALALAGGTAGEGRAALKQALLAAIKLAI